MKPWSKFILESTGKDPITGAPIKKDPITGQPDAPSKPATSGSKKQMSAAEKRKAAEQIISDLQGQRKKSSHQEYLERVQAFKEKKYEEQRQKELENKRLKQEKDKQRKEKELERRKQEREKARKSITSKIPTERIGERDPGATAYAKAVGNVASFTGSVAKRIGAIASDKMKEKMEAQKNTKKPDTQNDQITSNQPERKKRNPAGRPPKKSDSGNVSEELKLILEIEKDTKEKRKKIIDIMRGKNKIEINPNISEDHKEIESGKKKDDEGYMANVELDQIERSIRSLRKKVKKADTQLPAWVQSKITRAADYIDTASEYLQSDEKLSEEKDDKRYCKLCRKEETKNECSYGPSMWEKYTVMALNAIKDKKRKKNFQLNSGIIGESKKSEMKCNKPKAQAHGSGETGKSHVVKACEGGEEKLIRFGQLGVKGSPKKEGESKAYASRRKRFKTRHAKNIAKGKMSAAYWANKVKW
jgi:hypothetical protein